MSADDPHDSPGKNAVGTTPQDEKPGFRRRAARAFFAFDPAELHGTLDDISRSIGALQHEMELLRDERLPAVETRLDRVETVLGRLQEELTVLRDERVPATEVRLDEVEESLAGVVGDVADLRDERLPAAVERMDVLVDRLAAGIEEVASLTERSLQGEPLPVPVQGDAERRLARELQRLHPTLLEAFRGSESEIAHRLDRYLPLLRDRGPVLDLGSGRGELVDLLTRAGVEVRGVEGDPALAAAARRRGLDVTEGDVARVLSGEPDGSWGAVTAVHFLEHLDPGAILGLLAEVRRVLRSGGLFVAECPNPHNIRVGASLFWTDPTHVRPLLPETLTVLLKVSGFEVLSTEYLHPFDDNERLETGSGSGERLDELINGPRDFVMVAASGKENGS